MSHHIRFITYNIRKGKGASVFAGNYFKSLGNALRDYAPDLLLCQEVSHFYYPMISQSVELGKMLSLNSYYEPNKHRRDGHHGNATFTCHPVTHACNYDVSTNKIERRGVLYVCLEVARRKVHVLNVHLGLNQAQRIFQLKSITAILANRVQTSDAVIMAGDFNDWNRKLEKIIVNQLGFINALGHLPPQAVRTWHSRRPVFNLDRVYVRNIATKQALRLVGSPWRELSDHLPLIVDFDVTTSL
ncbi:MAG: endonuclease/exonuclease/phosphatase family protein [Deltaproteobacteria bacterium]|nr:endonuclease/exonuclease/phosphatase family protein [Deltaproteobacteria bacterium]